MKHENEFDELARQKLEGRSIPFEESDWTAMQGLLKAEKSDRGGVFGRLAKWLGGAALLAILGIGVWKYTEEDAKNTEVSAVATTVVEHMNATKEPATSSTDNKEQTQREIPEANTTPAQQEINRSTTEVSVRNDSSVRKNKSVAKPVAANTTAASTIPQRTNRTLASYSPTEKTSSPSTNNRSTIVDPTSETTKTDGPTLVAKAEDNRGNTIAANDGTTIADANETPGETKGDQDVPVQKTNGTSAANADPDGDTSSTGEPAFMATAEPDQPAKNESGTADKDAEMPNATDGMDMAAIPDPQKTNDDAEPIHVPFTNKTVDTVASTEEETRLETTVKDTTTAVPEPAPIAPLITPRSPWQLSILGGAMNTSTRYSGSNSEEWNAGIKDQWTANAGVELVHMGRNFGIGSGLHYSTYSEQIQVSAKDRSTLTLRNFWYLSPIDTTILFITDTIQQGGETVYVGQSISTTVNVLAQGTDSSFTSEQIRDARSTRNKVSYVEVPLLLDAHLVQGRWSIGFRGGPTVGLLTGRKGSLPNSNGEGYTALNDQPFREVVFGWTARAYVRYRFNEAWSIGVEPMVRGQLFNTLGSGDLSRKSTAYGGVLSLSYLLR